MKKFKLIKEYPGSPKLATELTPKVDKENTDTNNFYWEGSWFNPNDFSEYWEEVIEKDYEILSYANKTNLNCITTKRRGTERHDEFWNIHSVKRLSDGEVFTVGDRVKVSEYGSVKTITDFIININPLVKEGMWLRYDSGSSHLSHATKAKQPIFLTHDGKDIFVGDRIIWVNKDSLLHGVFTADYGSLFLSDQVAYFLSAVDAQDYIQKNQVLFTTEDGVDIKRGDMIHGIYKAGNIFAISSTVVRNDNRICEVFEAIFSTIAAAENYVVQKSHSLSIEDFWEFVSKPGSNIVKQKALKRLVKERLKIK
jgi:hypothetical protein